jgi:signal transduction histidine kinase
MSADQFLQFTTQAVFLFIFVVVGVRAIRHPRRITIDIALFFAALALIIAVNWLTNLIGSPLAWPVNLFPSIFVMTLPYLLLRLLDDFAEVPVFVLRAAEVGLALSVLVILLTPAPLPAGVVILLVIYFVVLQVYAAVAFIRASRKASGVTNRRLQAAATGSLLLGLVLLTAGFRAALPDLGELWTIFSRVFGLSSGISYALGFAPPAFLRRAWQEPELRAFLGRAASLPRLPDTASIVQALEHGAATSVGAPGASIGLWDPESQVLRFHGPDNTPVDVAPGHMIAGRVFASQRAIFSGDVARDDPDNATVYREYDTRAILAAPITAGDARLGVLAVYSPRAPIFADDDLELVQLLADQAAVILESRALIDEASRVRAREEANRLKDDFLSSAAHDLRSPLTTLVAQAQLLELRATRFPDAPADKAGIQRLVSEGKRLQMLVGELLDAARAEQGKLIGEKEVVDLAELVRAACARERSAQHRCVVDGPETLLGMYDRHRIEQLIENLLENAIKYSPTGGDILVRIWREGEMANLTVADRGIGIPADELAAIFERFRRGSNVDDRRFAGMGLGLFICRGIVEQHGGQIWATSAPGQGTTFHVTLPANAPVLAS